MCKQEEHKLHHIFKSENFLGNFELIHGSWRKVD
jgi:hypothetical protein